MMQTKAFTDDALESITVHRPSDFFLGNDQTQSGVIQAIVANQQQEPCFANLERCAVKNRLKLRRPQQSVGGRKSAAPVQVVQIRQ